MLPIAVSIVPALTLKGLMRLGFAKSESDSRADGADQIVIEIVVNAIPPTSVRLGAPIEL